MGGAHDFEAYVFVPDDARLRQLVHGFTTDARRCLGDRDQREAQLAELAAAQRAERERRRLLPSDLRVHDRSVRSGLRTLFNAAAYGPAVPATHGDLGGSDEGDAHEATSEPAGPQSSLHGLDPRQQPLNV